LRFAVPIEQLVVWLLAVPVAAAIVLSTVHLARRRSARRAFGDPGLLERLAKNVLVVFAVLFLGLAAGRPQIGTRMGVAKRRGVDLMIAIDVSASMRARDLKPNRLEKARREASALIDLLDGDRVGVITFSGAAFVQCPLTLDYGAASMLLSAVEPGTIPRPGTALGDAIRQGVRALSTQPDRSKVLVIMTDGEDHGSDPIAAAGDAAEAGVIIHAIGLGSTSGEPIPLEPGEGSGYKRDRSGQIVMSRLDESTLIEVAAATGGRYFRATDTERELAAIEEELSRMEQGEIESMMTAYYEERFQLPLALALGLMLIESFLPDGLRRRRNALGGGRNALTGGRNGSAGGPTGRERAKEGAA
jgi:Ca-activated chloride channel family protein